MRLAVLGQPVAHSRSPAMQNAALAALGLGTQWRYEAIEVGPDGFERLVRSMESEGFAGANVTVPHKGAALAVADELSEVAREIGAANTLVFDEGQIRAYNTDAEGLLNALPASPEGTRSLVLGAGGAARAVVWALVRAGAEVEVWNRTGLRSQNLCAEVGGRPVDEPSGGDYGLIVNSTSGRPRRRGPLRGAAAAARAASAKARWSSTWSTAPGRRGCSRQPQRGGAQTVDGIEVLVRQGAISLRIWTGVRSAARSDARGGAGCLLASPKWQIYVSSTQLQAAGIDSGPVLGNCPTGRRSTPTHARSPEPRSGSAPRSPT